MRIHSMRAAAALATLLLGAANCPNDPAVPDRLPDGRWGGAHIGMVVADTGATIEYDCAMGTIAEPLRLGADGTFDWRGVHYPGHGGPTRIDEPKDAHPARYTGRATADRLTLTVTPTDGLFPPQTFTLTRGGDARVVRCL